MLRRHSDDNKKSRKARKLLRSKSMDVQSNLEASKNEKPEKEKDLSQPLKIEVDQCTSKEQSPIPNNIATEVRDFLD